MIFQICLVDRCHSLEGGFCQTRLEGGFCQAPRADSNSNNDEWASFINSDDPLAHEIRGRIERSVSKDMQQRIVGSLQNTAQDLHSKYPDEFGDVVRLQIRSHSDLSDLAGMLEEVPLQQIGKQVITKVRTGSEMNFQANCVNSDLAHTQAIVEPLASTPVLSRSCSTAEADSANIVATDTADVSAEANNNGAIASFENANALAHEGLLDHEQLIGAIYASQGLDLQASQLQAREFLKTIGLRPVDMGVSNLDENGQQLLNQCFYLSMARAFLGHEAPAEGLALRFRSAIEASVLAARPSWAAATGFGSQADNGSMAFADFLPIAMKAEAPVGKRNVISELVVCIFDSVGGHVEVYIGPNYSKLEGRSAQERNMILLWYTPGHYHCLVRDDVLGTKFFITYTELKDLLTERGVVYIETTG